MGVEVKQTEGPDLRRGVAYDTLREGEAVLGHADGEAVLLVRRGSELFAIGATCTHYGAPLADGLVTGDTIRCPWHHACFSLHTGAALRAPALNALPRYRTIVWEGKAYVLDRDDEAHTAAPVRAVRHSRAHDIVVIGAGAAGHAAVETLRAEGHDGAITVIDPDADAPYDRPNLSKDYLAGSAPEEWLPLRPPEFYRDMGVDRIVAAATAINCDKRTVTLSDGRSVHYGSLLLATGAAPVRPPVPGADQAHVYTLRSLADCRALIAAVADAERVVIAGASFIGLEAAAALRARGVDVMVVAPEAVPFARTFGSDVGEFLRGVHEEHGVRFQLGRTIATILADAVVLDDGSTAAADVVLLATGVRPLVQLAADAGLVVDNGVLVNGFLETSRHGIFAAGDIARYPTHTGLIRVEHWVVAQRQGQVAARNMLGQHLRFDHVPFFWTQQYDVPVAFVGFPSQWDRVSVDGSIQDRDCTIRYFEREQPAAVLTINRDIESLRAEVEFEARSRDAELAHA